MMDWLRKHQNVILMTTVGGFILSMFVGFGLYMRSGGAHVDTVLEVNDDKIPYSHFSSLYTRLVNSRRDKGEDLSPEVLNQIKGEVINGLIQEAVFYREAERYGMKVYDGELAQSLASVQAFQKEGKFDIQTYAQALHYGMRTTPEEFEESQRKQIAIARLRAFVLQGVKVGDKELEQEYALQPQDPKKPKTIEQAAREKQELREKLRQEKAAQVLNRWYQQLGSNLQVKNHLDDIEKRGGR